MKTRLAYRLDIVTQLVMDMSFQLVNLVFIFVIFQHTSTLQGWNQYQILFIYGYFLLPWSIFGAFFNLWDFNDRYMIKGELDRILTRPIHSLFQILLETMTPESLVSSLTGVAILVYSSSHLGLDWSVLDGLYAFVAILGGVAIYGGIYISLTVVSLYSDSKSDLQAMVFNVGTYGRYPVTIYHRYMRWLLTFLLPFGFVGFYPATFFLKQMEWKAYALATPLVGVVYLSFSVWLWNRGIRHYRGTGS